MLQGAGSAGAVDQLDYFDALEARSAVTWDELLAAVLLAVGKRADGTYEDRLTRAKQLGVVGTERPLGPAVVANSGDLAKVLLRSQGIRLLPTVPGEEACALAARRKLLPESLDPHAPLTGSLTVQALSAVGQPNGTTAARPLTSGRSTAFVPTPTPQTSGGGSEP